MNNLVDHAIKDIPPLDLSNTTEYTEMNDVNVYDYIKKVNRNHSLDFMRSQNNAGNN